MAATWVTMRHKSDHAVNSFWPEMKLAAAAFRQVADDDKYVATGPGRPQLLLGLTSPKRNGNGCPLLARVCRFFPRRRRERCPVHPDHGQYRHPTAIQTDEEWAQNLPKIISRNRPHDRHFRKLNPVNDLFKLIIEEIKYHQSAETTSLELAPA
jgi:hypothetical protein